MPPISQFQGPRPDDYANVRVLNNAFVRATTDMKRPQRGRLAAVPFLLFSLRERDSLWWDAALERPAQKDLLVPPKHTDPDLGSIQVAALSFLWHLSSRNPYAARIITGATVSWCDRITDQPLLELLDRVGTRSDLMRSRLDGELSGRLRVEATSSKRRVRRSSQLVALQSLLTHAAFENYSGIKAAACGLSRPLRVRDKKL